MDHKNQHPQVNIYDVSSHAGVSIATVSRVLNGSSKVAEQTRLRVLASMKALGYQPNAFARGLGLGSMKTVGMMVTDASDPFLAKCVYHTEQELKSHGYSTILSCTGFDLRSKKQSLKELMSKQIDGLILIGSSYAEKKLTEQEYLKKAAKSIPIVLLNGRMQGDHIYCIYSNDFESMFHLTSNLLSKGYRRILYLYWGDSYSGRQKMSGYKAALGAAGIAVNPSDLVATPKDLAQIDQVLFQLRQEGRSWDAIIGSEDIFAVAALKHVQKSGLKVPGQIEIVGYNNSILSQCTMPELSSVDNHCEQMSVGAASLLIQAMESDAPPQETMIACQLITRGTSKGEIR